MKKQIIKGFTIVILLLSLTSCGMADSANSPVTGSGASSTTPKPVVTKPVRNPQEITAFSVLSEDSLDDGKSFQYQDQEYQIQEYRIKGDTEENNLVLYWTLTMNPKEQAETQKQTQNKKDPQEIPLVDPQEIPHLDSLEKQEFPTEYILNNVFLLSGYLFYTYQECIIKPIGDNGAENDWGTAQLCRINLETMETDQSYILVTKEQEKAGDSFQIWGADPDSGYIYLGRAGNLLVLDLSLAEVDMAEFDSSKEIMDICWTEEGYVLTDIGIYQLNLALDENNALQKPKTICMWPSDDSFYPYTEIIGTYGRFLYGYTFAPANGKGNPGIIGYYFQVDLGGKNCKILSADQKKSYFGETDVEYNFDTESFADKHELCSEGSDHSDDSWDPIRIRYILSEDGSVEIETEKIDP